MPAVKPFFSRTILSALLFSSIFLAFSPAAAWAAAAATSATYTIVSVTATPTFSVAAGTYTSTQTVSLADSTYAAKIYYTTDGSTPTTSSTLHSGAISVSKTETLKAIAVASGFSTSAVASAAYTISN